MAVLRPWRSGDGGRAGVVTDAAGQSSSVIALLAKRNTLRIP